MYAIQAVINNSKPSIILVVFIRVFTSFVFIQYIGYTCLAETGGSQIRNNGSKITCSAGAYPLQNICRGTLQRAPIRRDVIPSVVEGSHVIKFAVAVIENRFIARGIITDIKRASKGIQKFTMQIKKTEQFGNYPNFGRNYQDKTVEIFSEIGIPSSFRVGAEVSVVLRVSGDERGQYLFLVEVLENGTKN